MATFKYNPEEQNKFTPNTGGSFMTVGNDKMFIPQAGQYKLRLLPPWSAKGLYAKFMKTHWGLGVTQMRAVCPDMYASGTCPFCYAVSIMRNNYDKYKEDIASCRAVDRYFSNIVNLGEQGKGVIVWAYGKLVYKQLDSIQRAGDYGDITDDATGSDLTLVRNGTGRQVQDTLYPVRQPSRILNAAWLDEMHDLDSIFKAPDADAIAEAFQTHPWRVWEGTSTKPKSRPVEAVEPEIVHSPKVMANQNPAINPNTPIGGITTESVQEKSRLEKLHDLEAKLRASVEAK